MPSILDWVCRKRLSDIVMLLTGLFIFNIMSVSNSWKCLDYWNPWQFWWSNRLVVCWTLTHFQSCSMTESGISFMHLSYINATTATIMMITNRRISNAVLGLGTNGKLFFSFATGRSNLNIFFFSFSNFKIWNIFVTWK